MRLPFLMLTPACLLPAFTYVYRQQDQFDYVLAALILVAALCAHISVNMFNEYLDFRSGLDAMTVRTAFSGGSGALVESPDAANQVLAVACLNLLMTLLAGLYFIFRVDAGILPVGLFGVIIIMTYTQWINRSPLLCLIAPGLAFGPLMSFGTFYVMTGDYSVTVLLISMPVFYMVNNLLLLNQLPDIDADKCAGRRHLMIRYGIETGMNIHIVFVILAALSLVTALLDALPVYAIIGLLPICLGGIANLDVRRRLLANREISPALALNVLASILTPIIMAAGTLMA